MSLRPACLVILTFPLRRETAADGATSRSPCHGLTASHSSSSMSEMCSPNSSIPARAAVLLSCPQREPDCDHECEEALSHLSGDSPRSPGPSRPPPDLGGSPQDRRIPQPRRGLDLLRRQQLALLRTQPRAMRRRAAPWPAARTAFQAGPGVPPTAARPPRPRPHHGGAAPYSKPEDQQDGGRLSQHSSDPSTAGPALRHGWNRCPCRCPAEGMAAEARVTLPGAR